MFILSVCWFKEGPFPISDKVVYVDKFSFITKFYKCGWFHGLLICTLVPPRLSCHKFWPKRTNLQTHRRQNLSQVNTGRNRLNKQNFVYLVIHMS